MRICANAVPNYKNFSNTCIKKLLTNGLSRTEKDIRKIIKKYLTLYNITYHYGVIADRDASMVVIKRKSSNNKKFLIIDSRLKNYPKPMRSLYLKRLLLHEIGHCFLNHPATRLNGWKNQSAVAATRQISLKQEDKYEHQAEICASVIGFWPEPLFKKRIKEFNYDLLKLADSFKFDVDCCAKYLLLRDTNFDGHYLKYNVDYREFEDYYIPNHYDPIFEQTITSKDLITNETAIAELINENRFEVKKKFCIKDTDITPSLKVTCKAFYVEKSPIKELGENDRIVVIGNKR